MLVHAKTPHIDVEINGKGVEYVVALLKKAIKDVKVTQSEKDSIPIKETDWFKEISKTITPAMALKIYRDNAELTLSELSKKTNIAVSHLSAMENEKRSMGKITAKKLGSALNCNYKRFL